MAAETLDLIGAEIIEQFARWERKIIYPGNVVGARLRGAIKKNFGTEVLQNFGFTPGDYNAATNTTLFLWQLRASQTAKLPIPSNGEFWLYDVLITLPSQTEPFRLLKGKVAVSPGVTE